MAIKLAALLRLGRKKFTLKKSSIAKLGFAAGAVTTGGILGTANAPPGARGSGTREGVVAGGILAGAATLGSAIIFRRIRGRIIPIRKKNLNV